MSLHAAQDTSPAVQRAGLEGTLTGLELLSVADTLDVQKRARSVMAKARDLAPLLADLASLIPDLDQLSSQITASIGSRGEVLDSATPTLGLLRHQVREAYQSVTEALERVIQSSTAREALQDPVVSMRSERLVLPVKAEMRHRIPGIVHDASNTGATLFIEPFSTVDLCNQWRELSLEEDRETRRVLRDLSALVGEVAAEVVQGSETTASLDLIMARGRYSASLRGVAGLTSSGQTEGAPGEIRLLNARHPLLGDEAVPVSVHIGPGWSVLVITGPNTGGKTVSMKTVGLSALMNQSGLHIPASEGSTLPVFDGIYADVGDQQSIERSVSTFSSHMRNVIGILSCATAESLVLLDELGTSTDPEEGAALAKAILGQLAGQGVSTVATTHHRAVAAFAEATPSMMNASVDLDSTTLLPTYHLTQGAPGRSYAMAVAAHLGLPDDIMEKARSLLEPQHLRFEDWLSELHSERRQLRQSLQEAEEARDGADATRRELEAQQEELALRRDEIFDNMRKELSVQYDHVRKKLHRARAALSWGAAGGDVKGTEAEILSAKSDLREMERSSPKPARHGEQTPLGVGDTVEVRGLGVRGTVVSKPQRDGEIEVAIGSVRLRLETHRLSRADADEESSGEAPRVEYDLGPSLTTMELDLRGMRAEEAVMAVDEFLDKALRDGLSTVRIIHGKGTGSLRRAIRESLTQHPLARSYSPESPNKGGEGATVVELM